MHWLGRLTVVVLTTLVGIEANLVGTRSAFAGQDAQSYIGHGEQALEPFSHVLFCKKQPAECKRSQGPLRIELTVDRRSQLSDINSAVNQSIVPQNDDGATMGGDVWTLSPKRGDCEDFAITKRHQLVAAGWPSSALRLAIAFTGQGEGHLVLLVATNEGDLVLDSLRNDVRRWDLTGLRWQMVQSAEDPRIWYSV